MTESPQRQQELREAARRIVESSCREQGVEVEITDPVVLGKVASILRLGSDSPLGLNPARIKPVAPSDGRGDSDQVEDGSDHGALAA